MKAVVNRAHLIDEHASPGPVHLDLRPEDCSLGGLVEVGATTSVESWIPSLWIATAYLGTAFLTRRHGK